MQDKSTDTDNNDSIIEEINQLPIVSFFENNSSSHSPLNDECELGTFYFR